MDTKQKSLAVHHDKMAQAHRLVAMQSDTVRPTTVAEARRQMKASRAHEVAAQSYRTAANPAMIERAELDAKWAANRTAICAVKVQA